MRFSFYAYYTDSATHYIVVAHTRAGVRRFLTSFTTERLASELVGRLRGCRSLAQALERVHVFQQEVR